MIYVLQVGYQLHITKSIIPTLVDRHTFSEYHFFSAWERGHATFDHNGIGKVQAEQTGITVSLETLTFFNANAVQSTFALSGIWTMVVQNRLNDT